MEHRKKLCLGINLRNVSMDIREREQTEMEKILGTR